MLTIQPRLRATMSGSTSWHSSKGACRFASIVSRKSRSENFRKRRYGPCAALFTTMSTGPSSRRQASTKLLREAASITSPWIATAVPPRAWIVATVSRSVPGSFGGCASRLRATAATRAPPDARRCAIAAPMPRLAPVTSATLSLHSPAMGGLLCGLVPAVGREEPGHRLADRVRAQAELLEAVAVARLVGARAALLGLEHRLELRAERQPELRVDLLDRAARLGDELAVVDDRVARLRVPRQHLERVLVGVVGLRGEHAERAPHLRLVPAAQRPADLHQLQQARNRVVGVA